MNPEDFLEPGYAPGRQLRILGQQVVAEEISAKSGEFLACL
jgi:hypothetical protein